jgi:hypothetical protein
MDQQKKSNGVKVSFFQVDLRMTWSPLERRLFEIFVGLKYSTKRHNLITVTEK